MIVKVHKDIAYYHAPKCGSRTILGWTVLINEPNLIQDNPSWFSDCKLGEYGEIRSRISLFSNSRHDWPNKKVSLAPTPIRFCVVRDPVERFVSCYTNRVSFHRAMGGNFSISELIDNFDAICDYSPALNAHFKPQCYFYGDNLDIFTHVFKMTELYKVKNLLQNTSGVILPDLHLQQNGACQKPVLSAAQIDWIKERYAEDYTIFGDYLV